MRNGTAFALALTLVALGSGHALAQMGQRTPVDDHPVVRAAKGDIGMFFRFGGLANMTAGPSEGHNIGSLVIANAGVKFALTDRWMLPVFFGTGLRVVDYNTSGGTGSSRTDWGAYGGVGFEYHFRIWRRISPFVGASMDLGLTDPSGTHNVIFSMGLGPQLGVEFFWGDRVSLAALYEFKLRLTYQDQDAQSSLTSVEYATLAGGSLMLTFYF